MQESPKSDLRVLVERMLQEAFDFFNRAMLEVADAEDELERGSGGPDYYWRQLSPAMQSASNELSDRLVRYLAQVAAAMRGAPLVGAEDAADLKLATKSMRAALRLRRYRFYDLQVINDEDRILGIQPASQSDEENLEPLRSRGVFEDHGARVVRLIALVEASSELSQAPSDAAQPIASSYRPGTAFIMMAMDPTQPALDDVVDTVKRTFRRFGIGAVRADDIEHDGQITQRVLDEIRTAEFLFGDLTGARPNVYYEVGYAHALGRRVALYRKSGTGLHFDLAGYNCPEYTSNRDLGEKLAKRLEELTNRRAQRDEDAG